MKEGRGNVGMRSKRTEKRRETRREEGIKNKEKRMKKEENGSRK